MIPTLRSHLRDMLLECLSLPSPDHMSLLIENIVKVVEWVAENEGLIESSDGGWLEWMLKKNLRTQHITPEERESFEEELATVFMNNDLDGDVTDKLLRRVGLK